jgi:hypothetical protein
MVEKVIEAFDLVEDLQPTGKVIHRLQDDLKLYLFVFLIIIFLFQVPFSLSKISLAPAAFLRFPT